MDNSIRRLTEVGLGEGERRGWFAPRPLPVSTSDLSGAIVLFWRWEGAPAGAQVVELERLYTLESGGRA